jgi:glycosyltransferase involved in cell wall biosynthesis
MRILIATPNLPWPLTEGGRVAQYRTFEALRNDCTFTLVVPVYTLEREADAKTFADKFPNVTVEAIRCFQISPPPTHRERLRMRAGKLLRAVFPPTKSTVPEPSVQMSGEFGPDYPFTSLNPKFVAAVEKQLTRGCDLFQAEFADMLTLGPLMAGRVPTLFVHHQLHYVYARRFIDANKATSANARYLTERMIREEAAYLNSFDSAIVFSEVDRHALNRFCPQLAVNVSPFPCPEDPLSPVQPFDQPVTHFVFVASESHRPNVDGLRWFMQEVWPAIKIRKPDTIIEVIGKWSHAAQTSLPNYADIRFAGFVPELGKDLVGKIMIVPVWIGSGIRTKILAAWAASCPVVTTTVGAEGLPGKAGEHYVVADDPLAFASACIELSQNLAKLNQMAASGLGLVQKHYSLAAVRQARLRIYEKLLANHEHKAGWVSDTVQHCSGSR